VLFRENSLEDKYFMIDDLLSLLLDEEFLHGRTIKNRNKKVYPVWFSREADISPIILRNYKLLAPLAKSIAISI
jgi:hypothetical protein